MIHVDLFSGIGGFALAAQWAGYETVMFCDNDPYCQAVLRKHWPGVPIIGDIRDVNKETVADAQVRAVWNDCANVGQAHREGHTPDDASVAGITGQARGSDSPPIDLLTGGFPCQPFSVAGKRGGTSDDRYLWPEMLRVISEVMPTWVLAENVGGLVSLDNGLVFDGVLSDLEGIGYEVQPLVIPACAVNAPHRRDRVWIVAHVDDTKGGRRGLRDTENDRETTRDVNTLGDAGSVCAREDVADTDWQGLQGHGRLRERADEWFAWSGSRPLEGMWESEPSVCRVANGIPRRVDRLRCLGNAIVPQVAYEIIRRMQ